MLHCASLYFNDTQDKGVLGVAAVVTAMPHGLVTLDLSHPHPPPGQAVRGSRISIFAFLFWRKAEVSG